MQRILLLVGFLMPVAAVGQSVDSLLSLEQTFDWVLAYHPMARQASLQAVKAEMRLRQARGGFDPKTKTKFDNKTFKESNYYTHWNSYLEVPTWLGIEVKAGFEQNTGVNLSDESDTDGGAGLNYAGISIPLGPLGRGFMIDERRATLQQAKLYGSVATAERDKMINKLLYTVGKDYWEWFKAFHVFRLRDQGYDLALFRFQAVKERVKQGDLAPIDSVEAKITLQQRAVDRLQAAVDWQMPPCASLCTSGLKPASRSTSLLPLCQPLLRSRHCPVMTSKSRR